MSTENKILTSQLMDKDIFELTLLINAAEKVLKVKNLERDLDQGPVEIFLKDLKTGSVSKKILTRNIIILYYRDVDCDILDWEESAKLKKEDRCIWVYDLDPEDGGPYLINSDNVISWKIYGGIW